MKHAIKRTIIPLHPRSGIPRRRIGNLTWVIFGLFLVVVIRLMWIWS
jgi:hypothetical protein